MNCNSNTKWACCSGVHEWQQYPSNEVIWVFLAATNVLKENCQNISYSKGNMIASKWFNCSENHSCSWKDCKICFNTLILFHDSQWQNQPYATNSRVTSNKVRTQKVTNIKTSVVTNARPRWVITRFIFKLE